MGYLVGCCSDFETSMYEQIYLAKIRMTLAILTYIFIHQVIWSRWPTRQQSKSNLEIVLEEEKEVFKEEVRQKYYFIFLLADM